MSRSDKALLITPGRKVQIVRPLEDVEVMEKEGATFSCEVSLDEVPAQWFWEGTKLRPSDNVRTRQEGAVVGRLREGMSSSSPQALLPPALSGLCFQEGNTLSSSGGSWQKMPGRSNLSQKMQNHEHSSE